MNQQGTYNNPIELRAVPGRLTDTGTAWGYPVGAARIGSRTTWYGGRTRARVPEPRPPAELLLVQHGPLVEPISTLILAGTGQIREKLME